MKALVIDRPGSFEHLRVADVESPEPSEGMLLVRTEAAGLNPVDYKLLLGGGHPAWVYPFVPGLDVAGVVSAVGAGVDRGMVGKRVFGHLDLSKPGALAELALLDARAAAEIPAAVSSVHAAAIPCAGLTAFQAIHRKLHVEAGDWVLVHAGAGGVGGFAIQLAARVGARVLTTCSAEKFEWVRQLGAEYVLDYRSGDVPEQVRRITGGRGVDAVVESLGEASATEALSLLAFSGRLACIEALPDLRKWRMFEKGLSVHELTLGGAYRSGDDRAVRELGRMGAEMIARVASGEIDPMVGEVVELGAAADALERLSRRHVRGKIVVSLS